MYPIKTLLRSGLVATTGLFTLLSSVASAQNLYYDTGLASGSSWFGADRWNDTGFSDPFDQNWMDGSIANFEFGTIKLVSLSDTNVAVGGIVVSAGSTAWFNSTNAATMTFSGGSMSGNTDFRGAANLSGNLTFTSGSLLWTGNGGFSGTLTNEGGSILPRQAMVSSASNFIINSGTMTYQASATFTNGGHVTVNGGELAVGTFSSGAVSAEINSLQGTGGTVMPRLGNVDSIDTLIVNQTSNTTYSGNVAGVQTFSGGTTYLTLEKSGAGSLTLSGTTVNLREGTIVSGGTLLINGGTTRNFEHISGSNAITVANGGTFGGTSTLAIFGGDNVVVQDGGSLAPGNGVGNAGRTTFSFQSGGGLDLSGVTSGTGWLKFDLGASSNPGTTYDQLRVTNGTLNIGTGILNFNDFDFNTLAGFDEGTYTLFELTGTSSLAGTLGTSLSGTIPGGYFGTISLSGDNLILSVIPEPGTLGLALVGLAGIAALRRRRRL